MAKVYTFKGRKEPNSKYVKYHIEGNTLEHAKLRARKKWGKDVYISTGRLNKKLTSIRYPNKRGSEWIRKNVYKRMSYTTLDKWSAIGFDMHLDVVLSNPKTFRKEYELYTQFAEGKIGWVKLNQEMGKLGYR